MFYDDLSVAARELALYTENESGFYRTRESIETNLARKVVRGVYDYDRACKAFSYLVKLGADNYAREFASPGMTGARLFARADRDAVAEYFATQFSCNVRAHMWNDLSDPARRVFERAGIIVADAS